jgi:adenosyl cobinamide kinase/adenosyl cobinamide phosphate guanylyltransferase
VLGTGVIVVVLGGTRSGKSEVAERIAAERGGPVTYVATATAGDDPDFAARIAAHRERRPASWTTVEAPVDLPALLHAVDGTALVESTGSWIAAQPDLEADVDGLLDAVRARRGDTVLVGEEVGLSVHPPTDVGRRFVDAVGACNRRLAAVADRVLLVVAGRTLELDG